MELNQVIHNLLKGKRWSKVLSSSLTYTFVEQILKLTRKNFRWQSTYLMCKLALSQTKRAYSQKTPVIWTSAFFPVEIIWGLGLCPFSPEVASSFITGIGYGQEVLDQGEQAGYSRDICSFHRCIAGAAHGRYLPHPAALCASTHLCDGAPLLFQNISELYEAPFFAVDVPYTSGYDAELYVAEQLEDVWLSLAELTGQKPDKTRLVKAIQNSNEFRNNLQKVNEIRCQIPSPISGNEMLGYLYLFFAGQGSEEAANVFAHLIKELEVEVNSDISRKKERFRILWLHLKPYYSGEIMDFIENKMGAVLAFEEMSHVYWPVLDPNEPFKSLARKMLSHFAYKPVEERIATIKSLAGKYKVDGIIHFSHWGCRQSVGGSLVLKEILQKEGWPVLLLDGDCLDGRNEVAGAMLTRLQAFFEILEERKAMLCL